MDLQKEIKEILKEKKMSSSELARRLGTSRQNLGNKLRRNNLKVSDLTDILDTVGYEIKFVKKKKK